MQAFRKNLKVLAGLMAMVGMLSLVAPSNALAAASADEDSFSYKVTTGQSMTELVRHSIQSTVGAENMLSSEQLVAAETWAAQELGAEQLQVGQTVNIPKSVIQKNIDRSEALGDDAQAWAPYANSVDFSGVDAGDDQTQANDPADQAQQDEPEPEDEEQSATSDDAETDSESESDEAKNTSSSDDMQSETDTDQPGSENNDTANDSDGDSRFPWIVGGLIAAGGWYYLWRKEGQSK